MDTPSGTDLIRVTTVERLVDTGGGNHPTVEVGFQVSGGNRHAYLYTLNQDNSTTTIDVVVATDGSEHTLQGVIDGTTRELWMDGVMLGSDTAPAAAALNLDFVSFQCQRGLLASTTYVSKILISKCPEDIPA